MDSIILAVSILLYVAGLFTLVGVVMLARVISAEVQRKNILLALGVLLYFIALALGWYMQRTPEALEVTANRFELGGLFVSLAGWLALICVVGAEALRRVFSRVSESWKRLQLGAYWLSALTGLIAVCVIQWFSWYPWALRLESAQHVIGSVASLALLVFVVTGWRMLVSILTTGRVPDEYKV